MWLSRTWSASAVIGLSVITVACGGGDSDAVGQYLDEIATYLVPATDAIEDLNQLNLEMADLELSSVGTDEVIRRVRIVATVTSDTLTTVRSAREQTHETIPPPECAELHLIMFEALQLSEQGLLEEKLFYELEFSGLDGTRALAEGNRLMAEADRVKSTGLRFVDECK